MVDQLHFSSKDAFGHLRRRRRAPQAESGAVMASDHNTFGPVLRSVLHQALELVNPSRQVLATDVTCYNIDKWIVWARETPKHNQVAVFQKESKLVRSNVALLGYGVRWLRSRPQEAFLWINSTCCAAGKGSLYDSFDDDQCQRPMHSRSLNPQTILFLRRMWCWKALPHVLLLSAFGLGWGISKTALFVIEIGQWPV